jgi:hypothetical protein
MGFWIFLWKAVLILGVVLFAGMAVWVSIGGLLDIKRLFARIEAGHRKDEDVPHHT